MVTTAYVALALGLHLENLGIEVAIDRSADTGQPRSVYYQFTDDEQADTGEHLLREMLGRENPVLLDVMRVSPHHVAVLIDRHCY